jgi:glycosyltransferase involved in cell wall biosynthesis
LVSILIPCFNAERWIGAAIDSALAQTWSDREVIVVDDGSTDGSLDVIKSFGSKIRWESGPNRGGNHARNRLLELAGGSWLQYLDADDYLLPDKVASQVAFLAQNPDADLVYGPVTLEHWSEHEQVRALLPIPEPHDPWVLLARWYLPQTGSPLWRKQAVVDVGGWNVAQVSCQEHELYLRLLAAGKRFVYCPANGAVYRQWSVDTLWQREGAKTRQRRLAIVREAEAFLQGRGKLSVERLRAINEGRFECARMAWAESPDEARRIVAEIHQSQPGFLPSGVAAPPSYRLLYRWLGFGASETIAGWLRGWRRHRVGN